MLANMAAGSPGESSANAGHDGVEIPEVRSAQPDHPPARCFKSGDAGIVAGDLGALEVVGTLVLDRQPLRGECQVDPAEEHAVDPDLELWHRGEPGHHQRHPDPGLRPRLRARVDQWNGSPDPDDALTAN